MSKDSFDLIQFIKSSSIIQGSPESTHGKTLTDGSIENYGDFGLRSRKQRRSGNDDVKRWQEIFADAR